MAGRTICGQPLEAAMAAAVAGPPMLALDAVSTTCNCIQGSLTSRVGYSPFKQQPGP